MALSGELGVGGAVVLAAGGTDVDPDEETVAFGARLHPATSAIERT